MNNFCPIHEHLTLPRTICICDKYGFRTCLFSDKVIEVLVQVGQRSRVVRIESEDELVAALCRSSLDVPREANANLIVQIKDKDWGGDFMDLKEHQVIPNHSVQNVVGFMMVFKIS